MATAEGAAQEVVAAVARAPAAAGRGLHKRYPLRRDPRVVRGPGGGCAGWASAVVARGPGRYLGALCLPRFWHEALRPRVAVTGVSSPSLDSPDELELSETAKGGGASSSDLRKSRIWSKKNVSTSSAFGTTMPADSGRTGSGSGTCSRGSAGCSGTETGAARDLHREGSGRAGHEARRARAAASFRAANSCCHTSSALPWAWAYVATCSLTTTPSAEVTALLLGIFFLGQTGFIKEDPLNLTVLTTGQERQKTIWVGGSHVP